MHLFVRLHYTHTNAKFVWWTSFPRVELETFVLNSKMSSGHSLWRRKILQFACRHGRKRQQCYLRDSFLINKNQLFNGRLGGERRGNC